MASLDARTRQQIIDLIAPLMSTEGERRALLILTLFDHPLLKQLDYTQPTLNFVAYLVDRLNQFGKLDDNRPALWALLETAREQVGLDQKHLIDSLRPAFDLPPPSRLDRVFVAYSRKNQREALRLTSDLKDAGLRVWYDREKIKGGDNWWQSIQQGITTADYFIFCLSPDALRSAIARDELLVARQNSKPIFVIMLEDSLSELRNQQFAEISWLSSLHIINFTQPERYGDSFRELIQSLPGYTPPDSYYLEQINSRDLPNPFHGLEAFQEVDAPYFTGREDAVREIIDRLRDTRKPPLLALVGASGSGKSSLIRAGVVPALRQAFPLWETLTMRPGINPLSELADRLSERSGLASESVRAIIFERYDGLSTVASELLQGRPSDARFVLVIDQFEEVFTLTNESERQQFLEQIVSAANLPRGQITILITMRADFFDQLSSVPALANLVRENLMILNEMMPDQLRRSIETPARQVGVTYDEGLVDQILEDVRAQPGSLPLLQYLLHELFERKNGRRMTHDAYVMLGGVKGVLATSAESAYAMLDNTQQSILRRILLRLVNIDRDTISRRRIERSDLQFSSVLDDSVQQILNFLTEQRLLVTSAPVDDNFFDSDQSFYEISHEALLTHWQRLADWISSNRGDLRLSSDYLRLAQDWDAAGRNPDYLLRGSRLVAAQDWLERADATELQRTFILEGVLYQNEASQSGFEGRTVEEAVQSALVTLRLRRDDVDIEIIQQPRTGILGLGSRPARVRVTSKVRLQNATENPPRGTASPSLSPKPEESIIVPSSFASLFPEEDMTTEPQPASIALDDIEASPIPTPTASVSGGGGENLPPAPPIDSDARPIPPESVPSGLYLSLSLNTPAKWAMNTVYPITLHASTTSSDGMLIKLPDAAQEVTLVMLGNGISVRGGARFTMPVDREAAFTAYAYAVAPGQAFLHIAIYTDGEHHKDSDPLAIVVSLPAEGEQLAQLPPAAIGKPQDRPADLKIHIHVSPRANKHSHIDVVAHSPYFGEWRDDHTIPTALITRVKERLRLAIEAPDARTRLAELRGVGSTLWHEILPPHMNDLYKRLMPGTRTQTPTLHTPSVMIITEASPMLPYELAMPTDTPLCDLFEVTRWIDGLSIASQAEFPFGYVQYTLNDSVRSLVSDLPPLTWPDGGMMPPTSTFRPELVADSPAAGLHIVRAGDEQKQRQTSMVPLQGGSQDWAKFVQYQIAAITSKSPLVTLSTLCDAHNPTPTDALEDGEKSLALAMMRAGASAVVGTWWAVTPAEDRVFWRAFYQAVADHVPLGAAVARGRAAVRAFNPVQPQWLAYYAIGDPMATGYPLVEAEGYFELVCLDVLQNEEIRLMREQAYNFEVLLRRRAPAQYEGQRYRLRPWAQTPSQIQITTSMCNPITDMTLISTPDDVDVIRWHFTLEPRYAGSDLLQLIGTSADGTPVIMSDCHPLELETRPFHSIQGVVNSTAAHRLRRQIMLNHEGYRIDDLTKPFQGLDEFEVKQLDLNLRQHLSRLMRHKVESLVKMKAASAVLSDFLERWMSHRWWADFVSESHLSFTDTLINFPFEMLLNADQFLGTRCSIGYGTATSAQKMVTNIAVMVNDDTPNQQGIYDQLTSLVGGKIRVMDGSNFVHRPKEPFMVLQDMMCGARADVVHLPLHSVVLPGVNTTGLSLTCTTKSVTKTIRFESNAFQNATVHLCDEPLIFLNATQPKDGFDVVPMAHYAYNLLERGAGAVIAPCFAIPDQFAAEVATAFYTELFSNDDLTLGEVLMQTRIRLLNEGNPFGLVYMLFGSPEARYSRKLS
jgi:hypothetical protein